MTSIRFVLPMFALLSLAACGGQSGTTEKGSTANAVAGEEGGPGMGRHQGMFGPAGLLFAALHEPINLNAEQKAKIEAATAEVRALGPKPDFAAHKTALAAAVRAGKVDAAALQPKGPTDAEREQHQAVLAKALTTLHDTLTKEQRVALVDAFSKGHHGPMMGEGHGKGPMGGGPMGDGPKGKGGMHGKGGPMHGMLGDLELTQEQKDAIHAKLEAKRPTDAERDAMKAQHATMKKELDARLQTFVADTFDAKAFVTPPAGAKPPMMGRHPMLEMLEVITPILTPAQREKLATKIEQGPHPEH